MKKWLSKFTYMICGTLILSVMFVFVVPSHAATQGVGGSISSSIQNSFKYTHELIYNDNGGTGGPGILSGRSKTGKCEFTISNKVPTRAGYKFLWWAGSSNAPADDTSKYTPYKPGDKITIGTTKNLYAVWQKNDVAQTHTHILDKINCSNYNSSTHTVTKYCTVAGCNYSQVIANEKHVFINNICKVCNYKNVTISNNYTHKLVYNNNGGIGGPGIVSVTSDKANYEFTISNKVPTRAGYNFLWWSVSPNASADNTSKYTPYKPGDKITISTSKNLYAIWQKEPVINEETVNNSDSKYPKLSKSNLWYLGYTPKNNIEAITFSDNTDDLLLEDELFLEEWYANKEQSIKCYVIGPELIIAGNGKGKISLDANTSHMFEGFINLVEIYGLEVLDTSNVSNMDYMFKNCENLQNLDISSLDTSKVVSMNGMFENCKNLIQVSLNRNNNTSINDMYKNCAKLVSKKININNSTNGNIVLDKINNNIIHNHVFGKIQEIVITETTHSGKQYCQANGCNEIKNVTNEKHSFGANSYKCTVCNYNCAHKNVKEVKRENATCKATGKIIYSCENCLANITKEIPKINTHDWSNKNGNCKVCGIVCPNQTKITQLGTLYVFECSNCGLKKSADSLTELKTLIGKHLYIETMHNHIFGELEEIIFDKTTHSGKQYCQVNGCNEVMILLPEEHYFGPNDYECEICHYIACNHENLKEVKREEATCKQEGKITYMCEICSKIITKEIPKNNKHSWKNGKCEFCGIEFICSHPMKIEQSGTIYTCICYYCAMPRKEASSLSELKTLIGNHPYIEASHYHTWDTFQATVSNKSTHSGVIPCTDKGCDGAIAIINEKHVMVNGSCTKCSYKNQKQDNKLKGYTVTEAKKEISKILGIPEKDIYFSEVAATINNTYKYKDKKVMKKACDILLSTYEVDKNGNVKYFFENKDNLDLVAEWIVHNDYYNSFWASIFSSVKASAKDTSFDYGEDTRIINEINSIKKDLIKNYEKYFQ